MLSLRLVLGLGFPASMVGLLYLGELNYSPLKQRQYPASYGLNEKIERVREELKREREGREEIYANGKLPKAVVSDSVRDFGIVAPHGTETTEFSVTNAGEGVLKIRGGDISCKCVDFGISNRELLPGETATVSLTWNTGRRSESIVQTLSFTTNDPDLKELRFEVHAKVAVDLASLPETLNLGRILPGKIGARAETTLFSEEFVFEELPTIESSDSRLAATWGEAAEVAAVGVGTVWARTLIVESTEPLPAGALNASIRIRGQAADGTQVETSVPVVATVPDALTVAGAKLADRSLLELGTLRRGEGIEHPLILRVNDDDPRLSLVSSVSNPEGIEARLEPIDASKGVYRLIVTVPKQMRPGSYSGDRSARLHLEFDHPAVRPWDLNVSFVVLSDHGG